MSWPARSSPVRTVSSRAGRRAEERRTARTPTVSPPTRTGWWACANEYGRAAVNCGKRSIVARSSGRYWVSPLRYASHIGSAPLTGIRHHGFSSERGTPDITHSTSDLRSRERRYTAPP